MWDRSVNPFEQTVDPLAKNVPSAKERFHIDVQQRFREQVISVFANPHGMQLLDTLDDLYVRQPVSPAGCVEGYGYMREGENRLIIKLRAIVNSAQGSI
ncbi:hypothetical protein UFOVP23_33 [uncultured Caudovirales phage]|uniref:Uncharacterized protein n=1 Tax=uncultured Caudovirales phage TaxID=2100421 RepID=A0A6J5T8L0_9CAUD|nr:hypothetical protein UFOVP23_33 [uncultured Caudovirales phage]